MNNIKSAKDVMNAMANVQPVGVVKKFFSRRTTLSESSDYHYCPICKENVRRSGKNWKEELKPMSKVYYMELIRYTDTLAYPVETWMCECSRCKMSYTYEQLTSYYTKPYKKEEGQRYIDLTKVDINDPNFALRFMR